MLSKIALAQKSIGNLPIMTMLRCGSTYDQFIKTHKSKHKLRQYDVPLPEVIILPEFKTRIGENSGIHRQPSWVFEPSANHTDDHFVMVDYKPPSDFILIKEREARMLAIRA